MLETTECIPIKNNGRDYTDCMEFSLLRFLHVIFYSEEELNEHGFSTYKIDSENEMIKVHPDLLSWIERYPKIYREASYYTEKEGSKEREDWSIFVSDRPYFEYYRTDGAELFTNIRNIGIFCKELLGMDLEIEDSEPDILRTISSILSGYKNKKIKIHIGYKEKDNLNLSVDQITAFVSKPQYDIYQLDNRNKYGVISKRTILHLDIDSDVYNWNLYEVFFKNEKIVCNKFITGHSAFMG